LVGASARGMIGPVWTPNLVLAVVESAPAHHVMSLSLEIVVIEKSASSMIAKGLMPPV